MRGGSRDQGLSMRVWRKALHCEEWQPWFAWHPIAAGDSLVWLQWVERRRCYAVIDKWWECRLPHPHWQSHLPGQGSRMKACDPMLGLTSESLRLPNPAWPGKDETSEPPKDLSLGINRSDA